MLKNHSMSSIRAFLLDCFLQTARLLITAFSSDGQVPLRQFIIDNPLHIPPDASPSAECNSCQNFLLETLKRFLRCTFSNRAFSVDGTNVSGGLCRFGVLIEHVKKKVSEMFIL
jgi:hypothetical protein